LPFVKFGKYLQDNIAPDSLSLINKPLLIRSVDWCNCVLYVERGYNDIDGDY